MLKNYAEDVSDKYNFGFFELLKSIYFSGYLMRIFMYFHIKMVTFSPAEDIDNTVDPRTTQI